MHLGQDGPSLTDWLKAPGKMVDWFKTQMQSFFTLPARIAATRQKAERVRGVLQRKGDQAGVTQVDHALAGLSRVSVNHAGMQGRVSDLFSKLGALGIPMPGLSGTQVYQGMGIPAIPVALLVTGAAVALGIAAIFSDYRKQAELVESVAAGRLSAEEAKALGGGRALFGLNLDKLALPVGGLLALFFLMRAGRRRMLW